MHASAIMLRLRWCLMLLFLTLSRPSFIEARKPINKVATARKSSFKWEEAKKEVDYVLSIERAVERAEFRRLPEEEALPKDPKLWAERTAREAALLERHMWISEVLPPGRGTPPRGRRANLNPHDPYHNLTTANTTFLDKRLIEALNEEALDPMLHDDYDDDLSLVRDLKDRVGEKVLTAWRKRVRFRPPADKLRFNRGGRLIPVHEQLKVPVMMRGSVRALLRRRERELRPLPLPDTTPRTPPTPPRGPPPPPGPSRRRYEMEKWLAQFEPISRKSVSKFYTLNIFVSESWISKLWYYSTPHQSRLKMWAFRKMQESIYHVQDWVAVLDDVLVKYSNNFKFNIFYTTIVFEALLNDILVFWTFLRRRFYLSANLYATKDSLNLLQMIWHWKTLGYKLPEERVKSWRQFGKTGRTNDISRHLVYYTMVVRRYVDLMSMSEQITAGYETYLQRKTAKQLERIKKRLARMRTRTRPSEGDNSDEGSGSGSGSGHGPPNRPPG